MMNLKISALEFVEEAKNGNVSVEEFIGKTLERINDVDDKLHAFLSINDKAIDQARDIDKRIKSGEKVGACFGMPISIKDNMCIKECQYQSRIICALKILKLHVHQKCSKIL